MKSVFVEDRTLNDTWFKLLYEVYHNGRVNHIDEGSFAGSNRLEFDFASGTIHKPTERPLAPIMPVCIPPVTTEQNIEDYFVNYLMDGTLTDNEHYKYATWVVGGKYKLPSFVTSFFGGQRQVEVIVPNQVQWCIDHYKTKGYGNNHCYIQVGYPESSLAYDQPYENESERGTSPCLRGIDTAIKDGKLCFHIIFRSWDLFAGFPENMGGLVLLMEYMANELNVDIGTLNFSCMKLHCYDFQLDVLKTRLGIKE